MREIISVQCGQAGNQVSSAFWETILQEHGLDKTGHLQPGHSADRLGVFFQEAASKNYVPRAVAVDLEPGTIDNIRGGDMGALFRPDNLICGRDGAGNNWAKGFYTDGVEILEPIMDSIRREVELTDSLQGFQFTHSLGGGTGSGLGTQLMSHLREEYNDKMISTYSILPNPKVSEGVTEPYNAVLAMNQLVDCSDATFCLDNEALYNICTRNLKIQQPSHHDLNRLIAMVMSGVTTGLRFPGQLNGDLRKLAVNLVPFSRLHFFTTSFAPLFSSASQSFQNQSVPELTQQLFSPNSMMAACDPTKGRYLTISTIFRGDVSIKEVEDCIFAAYNRNRDLFVDWIPNNFQTSVCSTPSTGLPTSATFIANTTAVQELFNRSNDQFFQMFRRKAFLHWYTSEGMDESEFQEAYGNLLDLVVEYDQFQKITADTDMYAGEMAEGEYMEEEMEEA